MSAFRQSRVHAWTQRRILHTGERLRVLVVDDNQDAANALAAYLAYEDMECRVAFGGIEAIEIGTEWLPQLVIMDISMPECNGYQAALALRKHESTRAIAIVAHTALDESEVRRHLADHEFDGYCQKAQPPKLLVALIDQMGGQDNETPES